MERGTIAAIIVINLINQIYWRQHIQRPRRDGGRKDTATRGEEEAREGRPHHAKAPERGDGFVEIGRHTFRVTHPLSQTGLESLPRKICKI